MTVTTSSPSLMEAALDYARRGWPVFPCNPANKKPLVACDKDEQGRDIKGTGGVSKATTFEGQIRTWWQKWPRAMIGVSVGRAGMLVVDFDPRREEQVDPVTGEVTIVEWTLEQLKAETEAQIGCMLPATLAARTPSGGVHVYYRMPEGEPIGNKGSLPQHVDVRGLGGYTILPPSYCDGEGKHAEGPYRWLRGDSEAPIVVMPAGLEQALRMRPPAKAHAPAPPRQPADTFPVDLDDAHRRYALNALDRELSELAATPIGGGRYNGRNAGIYHAAMKLGGFVLAGALHESVVRASLEQVVRAMPQNDDLSGALKAIDNGFANAKPRDLSAVGARTARGRGGARSFDPSHDPPLPPAEAYAGELDEDGPAPPWGQEDEGFHDGSDSSDAQAGGSGKRIRPEPNDALDRRCSRLPLTDLGNAERFDARHGWRFRFCPELGWFVWDGRRWELLSEEKDKVPGAVSLAVFDTVRAIRNEADYVQDSGQQEMLPDDATDEERRAALDFIVKWRGTGDNKVAVLHSDDLRAHAKSSEGAQRIGCIAGLVKSFQSVAIRSDAMDADRMAINVMNGTLRLTQKGKRWVAVDGCLKEVTIGDRWGLVLHPHRPEDLISKVAHVLFDPKATARVYDDFLAVVHPDETIRRFLHQWGGLSFTGDIGEQKLVFHHGGGRNGKSTWNDLIGAIAGDYGATIAIETFLDQGRGRKGGEATPDLARLPGVRFLRTSEPEKGAKLAEALIKLVTGGEPIDARFLNKGFFTFLPSFKLSVQGNHKPKITGHDDGIWRRMMLVPWAVQIAKEDVDTQLPAKLRGEVAGVFNRLLVGLLDWREHGLIAPDAVTAATAKYREQSDQLGRFLDECTKPVQGARSKSSLLFELFTAWAKASGAAEWQQVGFTKAMEDRGFETKRSNGIQWLDIEMVKQPSDFAEDRARRSSDDDPGPDWGDLPP